MDRDDDSRALSRRTPQQDRSKAKYDAILAAGLRVLLREGYAGASTVEIAREVGVSVGTLYAYFADKDELFTTFVDSQMSLIMETIASNVSLARYATVEDGIRDIITAAIRFTLESKPSLSAMVGKIPGVYDGMMLTPIIERVYEVAEEFYRAHGLVSTSDQARRVTYTLTGAVSGFFIRLVAEPDPPFTQEELADEMVALVMGYIGRYRTS